MSEPQQLVWFITGTTSSEGFGAYLVSSALSRGDLVVATGRSQEKLDKLFEKHERSENLRILQLDVTSDPTIMKAAVNQAVGFWGHIDVVVNNAGNAELGLVEETDTLAARRQFDTNFFGPLEIAKAILPHMRSRKSGTVVFVGSRAPWLSGELPGIAQYASSKAALHALADSLATEVAHLGIRVLLLAPGGFRTDAYAGISFHQEHPFPDYDELRTTTSDWFASRHGKQPGDPVKAMNALVDIVRGEGVAQGRKWPSAGAALLLGKDVEQDLYTKFDKLKATVTEWAEVVRGMWYPTGIN
ncbi:hypothetical protein GYMLUDRAFT_75365 [Collybiopsis luxurians FD-317 M1]|uniref:Uncharacterized protein n=1 Tax=Collybiopsis luxurians FD-317 M1 TaxID=944289 RepID=A0A0D0CQL9_9AGAR|nr:hypothetical protein GYMLUDRAFT_75365 [Collybiopsis luxurians FD-317 M1]